MYGEPNYRINQSKHSNLKLIKGVTKIQLIFTRHAESRPNGEPTNDSNRGLIKRPTFTACRQTATYRVPAIFTTDTQRKTPHLMNNVSQLISARAYSTSSDSMTHLDNDGRARMVDVSDKDVTSRAAEAECYLRVGAKLLRLLRDANVPKGDALTVAQIAGVVGAKKTSELIPLCHPLALDYVRVKIELPKGECQNGGDIKVHCEVRVTAKTGAEMEALTGAAVAALALYDMCKAVDKGMRVLDLKVVRKEGGRSGNWPRDSGVQIREIDTSPLKPREPFAPTNIMNF